MARSIHMCLIAAAISMAVQGTASAQYYSGYGNWGWGGWGGNSVEGSIARGLGYYEAGAGEFNQRTAVANSINADTVMRWNQYVWESQQEANKRVALRRAQRDQREDAAQEEIQKRILENPEETDIENGDALNAILHQLSDPRIHSSSLRYARAKVPSKAIKEIPFVNASEGIVLSLNQLTADGKWPITFQSEVFAEERANYQKAIAKALDEDEEGNISPETLANVRQAARRLHLKLDANKPKDPKELNDAVGFVKGLTGMARMLDNPKTEKVIAELKDTSEATIGSLLGFMHTYNLRFGPAVTPGQRSVYQALYPMLASTRDEVLKDYKDEEKSSAKAPDGRPYDFFSGMHLDYLDPQERKEVLEKQEKQDRKDAETPK